MIFKYLDKAIEYGLYVKSPNIGFAIAMWRVIPTLCLLYLFIMILPILFDISMEGTSSMWKFVPIALVALFMWFFTRTVAVSGPYTWHINFKFEPEAEDADRYLIEGAFRFTDKDLSNQHKLEIAKQADQWFKEALNFLLSEEAKIENIGALETRFNKKVEAELDLPLRIWINKVEKIAVLYRNKAMSAVD